MTDEELKAFEFAEKEELGCQSVELVVSDWQGYKVFTPVMEKSLCFRYANIYS